MTSAPAAPHRSWFTVILGLYLTLMYPVLLVLIAVRLVMTPLFLQFEYNRPGFPVDFYGFTAQDRLAYAPYALDYLLNAEDVTYLGDLRFPDGTEMYNARELHHMRDVKVVTQYAFVLAVVGGLLAFIAVRVLWTLNRHTLFVALLRGSRLTLGLIAAIVIISVTSWDTFFTTFHTLFFAGGTWQFAYSDTLIRLFPEQFWFDAALIIGGLSLLVSLITMTIITRQPNERL